MSIPNTDLLPPIFDQILTYYDEGITATYIRADIIKTLENGIVIAAANCQRSAMIESHYNDCSEVVQLITSDRLSGEYISRDNLSEQLQMTFSLSRQVIEIALLLVEAQIDLRLEVSPRFKLDGIQFERPLPDEKIHFKDATASWCKNILSSVLKSSQSDIPTIWNRIGKHRPEGLRVLIESLQLSATLRNAVPYKISIDRHLVNSKLAEPRSNEQIRLLHISDLHFVKELTHPKKGDSSTLGQKGHSPYAVSSLSKVIGSLQPAFDVLVATGDLTTDGASESFDTVLQYIQSGSIRNENKMRIAAFGLNAGKDRRLLIPGNHDRFDGKLVPGQRQSNMFEKILGTHQEYPYVRGFRPSGQEDNYYGLTLLLFVFDSNLPNGAQGIRPQNISNALAQGKINDAEIQSLNKLASRAKGGVVLDLNEKEIRFDPENTIRIALLHHHPVANWKGEQAQQSIWTRPIANIFKAANEEGMKLNGADKFLKGCFDADIKLILFGHQHYPYQRAVVSNGKCLRTFCCPTTLELSKYGNGFYLFDFLNRDEFSMDFYFSHLSNKNLPKGFSRISEKSGTFKFTELSDEERESAYNL